MSTHHWLRGGLRADRARAIEALGLPSTLTVDAHRRLRGPYTAAGTVLRELVPEVLTAAPELVYAHDIELLTVAPELCALVPRSRQTLTSLAVPAERTRFYSRLRTLRIAHGITEFLRDCAAGRALVVENVEHADPTDAELISVLLRRLDPAVLTVVVCTGTDPAPGPLTDALTTYPVVTEVSRSSTVDRSEVVRYVETDCTADDPALLAAYRALDPAERARLHDERAERLEALDERSLRLGAIPFHREHGSDPAGAGAEALRTALDYCIDLGFYHATVDFGMRGRAVIDWAGQFDHWWAFTTKMTTSLAALGRAEEAEALYDEARAFTDNPNVHMQAAYATAMLYTRHHEPDRRDDRIAKAWINEAVAIASLLPDPKNRAFQTAFNRNGLALIEVHLGDLPAALRLVDGALEHLAAELGPDEHRLHRSVLRYNRAQVLAALGRTAEAVGEYSAVIAEDPNYPEYHFDRANLLRRLGRDDDALADYETAIRLSPPFPEVHYNRTDVLLAQGDVAGALAGFDYVLELDPDFVDAYVNRAGIRLELGDLAGAWRDADAGLARDPENAHLHVVRAQVHAERGQPDAARAAYDRAVELAPELVAARSGRAVLAFEAGRIADAIADLDRAIEQAPDDPALRYNRAHAYEAAGRHGDALADLRIAGELAPDDPDITEALNRCAALVS